MATTERDLMKAGYPPAPEPAPGGLTEAQIKHMANRFLSWRLPKPFRPDNGISFTPTQRQTGAYGDAHWPVGTNLFGPAEAEDMIRHMLAGLPE